jgi:peptidoglycan/xylan/chitin deacetylase (PgdA/CDA1 family)
MTLRSELGAVRRMLLSSLHTRRVSLGNEKPVVSFCFDDFPRTAYTVGGAILEDLGVRGTYYVAMGLMNMHNHLGVQFKLEDLDSLLADGHELASHTFSHVSCRSVPFQVFEEDVCKGRVAICDFTGHDAINFSYPYGHVSMTAKKAIGAGMSSCRGIYGGVNGPMTDLNLLRANSLYGDVDRFAEFESLVTDNERQKGWLIFYTHDVRSHPSPFGCTPQLLERIVSLTLERGFSVLPVEEVTGPVQAGSPEPPAYEHHAERLRIRL